MTGPESVVLPLHHSPIPFCECKCRTFFCYRKDFFKKNRLEGKKSTELCKIVRFILLLGNPDGCHGAGGLGTMDGIQ